MIRNYIWDFDGMLFDSYPHMIEAMRLALLDFGVSATSEEIFAPIKLSVGTSMAQFLPAVKEDPDLRKQLFARYVFHEDPPENLPHAQPFPGVPEFLRAVVAAGGRNFVYSHRNDTLFDYLDQYGIRDCFVDFVVSTDGFPSKPAPDAINHLVTKHGLLPDETVMLGDREIDVLCGKNAGVHSCLFDEFGTLPPSQAEFRVHNHDELYDVFGIARQELND